MNLTWIGGKKYCEQCQKNMTVFLDTDEKWKCLDCKNEIRKMMKIHYDRQRYIGGTEYRLLFLRGAARELIGAAICVVVLIALIFILGAAQQGGTLAQDTKAIELSNKMEGVK